MPITPNAYEAFLNLSPVLLVFIVAVPSVAILLACVRFYRRKEHDQASYPLAGATLGLVGGAFIFVGAFSLVTSWDTQSQFVGDVSREFTSITSVAEDLGTIPGRSSADVVGLLVDYSTSVREAEIGFTGVVGPTRAAQESLAAIEKSVTAIAERPDLTQHQADNLYAHFEAVKDARKDRLMISVPNLPISVTALLLISALFTLLGIGLFPENRLRWFTLFYGVATVAVSTSLIVAVLVLQSPSNLSTPASKPIDMFLQSVQEGGANLGDGSPSTNIPAPTVPQQQPAVGEPPPPR